MGWKEGAGGGRRWWAMAGGRWAVAGGRWAVGEGVGRWQGGKGGRWQGEGSRMEPSLDNKRLRTNASGGGEGFVDLSYLIL